MVGILVVGVAFVTFFKGCIEYVDCMFMPSVEVSGLKCGYIYIYQIGVDIYQMKRKMDMFFPLTLRKSLSPTATVL